MLIVYFKLQNITEIVKKIDYKVIFIFSYSILKVGIFIF